MVTTVLYSGQRAAGVFWRETGRPHCNYAHVARVTVDSMPYAGPVPQLLRPFHRSPPLPTGIAERSPTFGSRGFFDFLTGSGAGARRVVENATSRKHNRRSARVRASSGTVAPRPGKRARDTLHALTCGV